MNRRLVIASAVLLLLVLAIAVVGLGSALTATGATPAPTHHGTMSGDFAHVPLACASARSAPSIFVAPDRWPGAGAGAHHQHTKHLGPPASALA